MKTENLYVRVNIDCFMSEKCRNPFFKCKGDSPIHVYITEDKIPVCARCWIKIAEKDYQWDP